MNSKFEGRKIKYSWYYRYIRLGVGFFAVGQFAVKKTELNEPNLTNLTQLNLTGTFFLTVYSSTAKKPRTIRLIA